VNQPEHAQILEWYRALIRLRRTTPCLNDWDGGNVRVTFDEEAGWLRIERGIITVLANLGAAEKTFKVQQPSVLELASHETVRIVENTISLPPDSVAVLSGPATTAVSEMGYPHSSQPSRRDPKERRP
jgi:maltooligosyltrehalose trehalohydrolase